MFPFSEISEISLSGTLKDYGEISSVFSTKGNLWTTKGRKVHIFVRKHAYRIEEVLPVILVCRTEKVENFAGMGFVYTGFWV
jgi:hypothetical protein